MKKIFSLTAITAIITATLLVSCVDNANIVKIEKEKYDSLVSAANKWEEVNKLADELVNRETTAEDNKNALIDTASGDLYMLNYKNSKVPPPRPSAGVDFDKEAIAFMIKYMLDNKVTNVRAGFGIYSNTANPTKNGFGTIIFGLPKKITREEWEKNPQALAITPFKFKKLSNGNDTIPPGPDDDGFLNWGDVIP